jgi:hypothetical protein
MAEKRRNMCSSYMILFYILNAGGWKFFGIVGSTL